MTRGDLAAGIGELWANGERSGVDPAERLLAINAELFVDRDLIAVDYASVQEGHWKIYALGANIASPYTWHMMLKGVPAPVVGWTEPWFPEAQRSASERLAAGEPPTSLLPAAAGTDSVEVVALRQMLPFGFQGPRNLVEHLRLDNPNALRLVLHGLNKFATPSWLDRALMLHDLLSPH